MASGSQRDAGGGPIAFLEAQQAAHPDLASWYADMADLYQRKLWHQLTLKLEQFLALASLQGAGGPGGQPGPGGEVLVSLYHNFITDIESKINVLKLAHFAVIVSRQYSDLEASTAFLDSVIAKLGGDTAAGSADASGSSSSGGAAAAPSKAAQQQAQQAALVLEGGKRRVDEALVYVSMQMAALKLQAGDQRQCKQLVDKARATLDAFQGMAAATPAAASAALDAAAGAAPAGAVAPVGAGAVRWGAAGEEVDPSVQASVFWVHSQYCKSRQDFAEFYRAALLYLAYVSTNTLTTPFKLDLAVDLSLAALLGENVYNFGELLAHPILTVLEGSPFEWLLRLLEVFERGNLQSYDALCQQYSAQLNAQPALVANQQRLREKITILCLLDLVFTRPAEERRIPLSDIAERTGLPMEGVEHLLMKTLSAHLIEGVIDQVDSTVQVTWVQPRVLAIPQVAALRTRLDNWLDRVHSTLLAVEAETPELMVS